MIPCFSGPRCRELVHLACFVWKQSGRNRRCFACLFCIPVVLTATCAAPDVYRLQQTGGCWWWWFHLPDRLIPLATCNCMLLVSKLSLLQAWHADS